MVRGRGVYRRRPEAGAGGRIDRGWERLVWTLVIIFTKLFGAALYYFMRYRARPAVAHS